jgi:hypothetical protein
MTGPRRRRQLAIAVVVAFLGTTGCAGPNPRVDYAGKAVPINVAFGKPPADKKASPAPGTVLAPAPSGVGVVPLVPGISFGPPGTPVPIASSAPPVVASCPGQDPFKFPRREATNVVDQQVPEGQFPYRITGSYTVNGKKTPYSAVVPETVKRLEPDAAGRNRFTVQYTLLGIPYTLTYVVTPPPDPNVPGEVALASIVQDGPAGSGASFMPAKPLRLLQLRAEKGVSWADATTDPLSASSATVNGSIAGKARVNACGQPVEAWQSQVSQRIITPGQDVTATRTLYFATGYGGLLVGEQVSYTGTAGGDTVAGQSTATINVDPGAP